MERIVDLKLPLILIDTLVDENDLLQVKGIIVNMDRVPLAYLSALYKVDPSKAPKVTIRKRTLRFCFIPLAQRDLVKESCLVIGML